MSLHWFPHPDWAQRVPHKTTVYLQGEIQTQSLRETQTKHTHTLYTQIHTPTDKLYSQHIRKKRHVVNGYRLPPAALSADYLALVMLCRSLLVCSERSEGTRISTGLIFRIRLSTSERVGPSGKQSSSTSPVLGWTAYVHRHMRRSDANTDYVFMSKISSHRSKTCVIIIIIVRIKWSDHDVYMWIKC